MASAIARLSDTVDLRRDEFGFFLRIWVYSGGIPGHVCHQDVDNETALRLYSFAQGDDNA